MAESTNDTRVRLFDTLLGLFHPGKAVDLGTGHGSFAIRAAQAGWDVTGVDARTDRLPSHQGVTWVHANIREYDVTGFDLIINLGLFYHLDLDTQLSLLDRCAGTPMILDTHVGVPKDTGFKLSDFVEERGYRGRIYPEPAPEVDPRASHGNRESFWPTPGALVRMLNERGWNTLPVRPWYLPDRTFFLCLPR